MRQDDAATAAEILDLLLENAKIGTIEGIYQRVQPGADGRIRTKLSPVGTETGRLSSSEDKWFTEPTTNLQNLPKKVAALDPLYEVRNTIVPPSGHVLLEADLSQAEAAVTAAYAGDEAKLDRILNSDEHKYLASRIFECSPDEVTKPQRFLGKMGNHGLNYGAGWKTFMDAVNKDADLTGIAIDAKQAKAVIRAWKKVNQPIVRWWKEVESQVRSKGYLVNAFGRKRIFLNVATTRGNDLIAFLPQSTIADLLNATLVDLFQHESELDFRIVHQIHDAILVEARLGNWLAVAHRMKQVMERSLQIDGIELTVPVEVEMSAESWGSMQEVEL